MDKSHIKKIIKEEIANGFDFLNNKKVTNEQEYSNIIQSSEFQKQFIIDSIISPQKINLENSSANVDNNPELGNDDIFEDLNVEYVTDIKYRYKDITDSITINLSIFGDNVKYDIGYESDMGSYDIQPTTNVWYDSIDWLDFEVNLSTNENDRIDFTEFKKAPDKIKELFIRSYLEPIIEKYSEINDIKEKKPQMTKF